MKSDYRRAMDWENPLYLSKTPKQNLGSFEISINSESVINEKYDEFILEWMADIYTCMQWKYNLKSEVIEDKIKPEDIYNKYSPLHETSIEKWCGKIEKD